MPVTLVLSRVSVVSIDVSHQYATHDLPLQVRLTLGSIAGLVVVGEPLEVLVLDPRHPVLVLVVVALLHPLEVALALLLLLGERVEGLLLLVFAHLVPAVAC